MSKTNCYKKENGKVKSHSIEIDEVIEIYKEDPLSIYPKAFFDNMRKIRGWQKEAGSKIAEEWKINSVVDFGCASGYYLEGFMEKGAKIRGYEYCYENMKDLVPENIAEFITYGDAQENLVNDKYDMSFSIEVAEHILPEKSITLVNNLCESSSKCIVFSAAPPGQGGTGHINERPFDEWKEMFESKGYQYSKEGTETLRNIFKNLGRKGPYIRLLSRQVRFFTKGDE